MQILETLKQKRTLVVEIIVGLLILAGSYYFVTGLQPINITDIQMSQPEQNLSPKFLLFLDATKKNNINLDLGDLFQKKFVQDLHDFSVTINREPTRGRDDPFTK